MMEFGQRAESLQLSLDVDLDEMCKEKTGGGTVKQQTTLKRYGQDQDLHLCMDTQVHTNSYQHTGNNVRHTHTRN